MAGAIVVREIVGAGRWLARRGWTRTPGGEVGPAGAAGDQHTDSGLAMLLALVEYYDLFDTQPAPHCRPMPQLPLVTVNRHGIRQNSGGKIFRDPAIRKAAEEELRVARWPGNAAL